MILMLVCVQIGRAAMKETNAKMLLLKTVKTIRNILEIISNQLSLFNVNVVSIAEI